VRVQGKPIRIVSRSQNLHGIAAHLRSRRDLGQEPPVRPAEPKLAIRLSIELIALLVDRAMVAAAEQSEIRERGGAALRPVMDVMPLPDPNAAARKATATVPMVERPP